MFKNIFTTLFIIFILISCGSDSSEGGIPNNDLNNTDAKKTSIQEVATDLCHCLEPLVLINQKMKDMQVSGDQANLQKAFVDLIKIGGRSSKCYQKISLGNKNIFSKQKAYLKAQLIKDCPNLGNSYDDIVNALDEQSGSD